MSPNAMRRRLKSCERPSTSRVRDMVIDAVPPVSPPRGRPGIPSISKPYHDFLPLHIEKLQKKLQTIFIFDWDDTLFPTTKRNDLTDDDCVALEISICRALEEACKFGYVAIITLAKRWWIDLCVTNMPTVRKVLSKIKIISAREFLIQKGNLPYYQERSYFLAKREAMLNAIKWFGHDIDTLINIGDSECEKNAAASVCGMKNLKGKFISMKSFPKVCEVIKNLDMISRKIKVMHLHQGGLDLDMSQVANISERSSKQYDTKLTFVRHSAPITARRYAIGNIARTSMHLTPR